MDFRDIRATIAVVAADYDHNTLNDVPPYTEINPSAENIARVIYHGARAHLADRAPQIRVAFVQVWESPTSWAKYWE